MQTEPVLVSSLQSSVFSIADEVIKPRKVSFLFQRFSRALSWLLVISVLLIKLVFIPSFLVYAGCVLVFPFMIFFAFSDYRKEQYKLRHTTLKVYKGGIIKDQYTEVDTPNITHVTISFPLLRHFLFGVGTIMIYSSGRASPILLKDIKEPRRIYQDLIARMKQEDYKLQKQKLLHQARPAMLGGFDVAICTGIVAFFTTVIGMPLLLGMITGLDNTGGKVRFFILILVGPISALVHLLLLFIEMRKRNYRIYEDAVVFDEGTLNRRESFIPLENIEKVTTKRAPFNLGVLSIKCRRRAQRIRFRHLKNAPRFKECIEKMSTNAK